MGLPVSPMCGREATNIPNMQMGFIDFIVIPFYSALFDLYPIGLLPLVENVQRNYTHYGECH